MLARISRIQSQLIQSWDVLSTLTPADYLAFRDHLGQASGFQSHQFRAIEFMMGNKNRAMLAPYRDRPAARTALEEVLNAPGLYDEVLRLLDRRGFPIAAGRLERDWADPYEPDGTVREAWLAIYRDTARHWDLYELAEELVDLEDWMQQWRFRHREHGRAHHRPQARHRRHGGSLLSGQGARHALLPRALGHPHRALTIGRRRV